MAQEIDIKLNVNTGQAEKQLNNLGTAIKDVDKQATNLDATFQEVYGDLQPLTARMGEAEDRLYELAKAGKQNTTEYKELLKTVGEYKRVQQETDKVVDAAAQTMASKLGGSLNAVAGGFSLAQGTMGLFGTESKDVEQAVLKVQSAMAISQGFETIREGAKSISALGATIFGATAAKTADTVATEANNASQSKNIIGRGIQIVQTGIQTTLTAGLTAATWLFNAAMAANPIGAIVAAIAILIASGYALINMFKESSAAAKKAESANKALANEIKNNKKEQDKANETFQASRDHQLGMAKASGKSAEEIRKLTLQLAKQEVQQNLTNYETNKAIALEALRIAGLEDATDAEKKTAQEAVKLSNESVKAVEQAVKRRREIESQNAIARQQEKTDAIKDSQEKQNKLDDDNKKHVLTEKEKLENLKKLTDEYNKKLREEDIQVPDAIDTTGLENKAANDVKFKEEELERQRAQELALAQIYYDSVSEREKREEEERQRKIQSFQATTEAVGSIAKSGEELLSSIQATGLAKGKAGQAAMKALALVQIGVDSAVAFSKMMQGTEQSAAGAATGAPGPAAPAVYLATKIAFYATGTATILANIARAKALLSGGGGGGGGAAGGGGGAVPPAPSFNVVGPSGANQIAESIGLNKETQPLKAFVVGGDVTSQQSLNRGIVQNATLG